MTDAWLDRAWRLPANRVSRFYRGGLLLDGFRGVAGAGDTDLPEDWVGSATRAWTPLDQPTTDEGLGDAELDGERRRVLDLVAAHPVEVAGAPDDAVTGTALGRPSTGILVKLLDAGVRLPVHAHPSRAFARRHLGSLFGKAEAWLVVATRSIEGAPPPAVSLGFRRDVGTEEFRRWLDVGGGPDLFDALHHRPTRAGDVWFVPPGTPHAIGAGVFIVELQEPTDFSIVLETRGFPIRADDAHLGLGWNVAMEGVNTSVLEPAALDALFLHHDAAQTDERLEFLPRAASEFFGAERVVLTTTVDLDLPARFVIGITSAGSGRVRTGSAALAIQAGDTWALPASAVPGAKLEADGRLEVIVCQPAAVPPASVTVPLASAAASDR